MNREPERRLDQLLLGQDGPQGEHHAGHLLGQVARQLEAATLRKQVDDGEVEVQPLEGREGLRASPSHVDDVSAAAQERGQCLACLRITIDEQDHACQVTSPGCPKEQGPYHADASQMGPFWPAAGPPRPPCPETGRPLPGQGAAPDLASDERMSP